MVQEIMRKLGFNDSETAVYVAILQQGKVTPANLAKITNINRSTVYSIAKQLVKKGVVTEDLGLSKRHFIALPPDGLENLIRQEEKELENKRHQVRDAINQLQSVIKSVKYSVPKIVFIEEEGIENYLYSQTPKWNASLQRSDGIWWGFQDPTFVDYYQEWIDWYWQKSNPVDISLRLLSNQGDVEETMKERRYERRQIKFWAGAKDFTATTWVNGDYLVMAVTNRRPHYLVEIYDSVLAHNMREVFKGLWEQI